MPSIEGIIRQAMSDDTGIALDSYLIDNVAASAGIRPAGLLNGVTPITASVGNAGNRPAMIADLKALVGAITAAGGGGRGPIAILCNPAQALVVEFCANDDRRFLILRTRGRLLSKFSVCDLSVSATVRPAKLIAVDAADFATALGDAPRFAVSTKGNAA